MLIVALIDIPDTDPDANKGTYGDAPDVVASAVLARVEDEPGYALNGAPYGPGEVTVYALTEGALDVGPLAEHAAATAIGHGPL